MAKVPNAERAVIPNRKITAYLLDVTHDRGGDKARFFLRFGFSMLEWEVLATALRYHIVTHTITSQRITAYGFNYAVEGELPSPDGRNPMVQTVWKIERGQDIPSFVTAYPMK